MGSEVFLNEVDKQNIMVMSVVDSFHRIFMNRYSVLFGVTIWQRKLERQEVIDGRSRDDFVMHLASNIERARLESEHAAQWQLAKLHATTNIKLGGMKLAGDALNAGASILSPIKKRR